MVVTELFRQTGHVVCINDDGFTGLIVGKIYKYESILHTGKGSYYVFSNALWCPLSKFITIEEHRENQLDKIL